MERFTSSNFKFNHAGRTKNQIQPKILNYLTRRKPLLLFNITAMKLTKRER